jgi:hypothetical protein
MICAISLRQLEDPDGTPVYVLRVSGKAALGPSGTGGQDERRFPSQAALLQALADLGLSPELLAKADDLMHEKAHTQRFVPVVAEVQIAFDVLERCDFYLEA